MALTKKEKQEDLKETLAALEKLYGKGTILTLDAKPDTDLEVYSTGSIGFDYIALGIGGYAKGKLYEVMGWEGTGKSTLCAHAVTECQKAGGTVCYIDGEHAVDKTYFQAIGVNTNKMLFSQPSNGEEGFNIALKLINTGDIDMIIIDSDSALMPKKQHDGDIGDSAMGNKAKLNSSAYMKLKPALSKHNVCVIVISQYREKLGVMFGNPTTTQGGHALKFYADVRIEVSKSLAKEGEEVIGNITKIRTIKNKMCPPYRKAEFNIIYGEGIDKIGEIMEIAKTYKLGKKYMGTYTFDGVKYLDAEFRDKASNDPDFYKMVVDCILTAIRGSDIPTDITVEDVEMLDDETEV